MQMNKGIEKASKLLAIGLATGLGVSACGGVAKSESAEPLSVLHPKKYIALGKFPSKAYVQEYSEIPGGQDEQCGVIEKSLDVYAPAKGFFPSPEVAYLAPTTQAIVPNSATENNYIVQKVDGQYSAVDEYIDGSTTPLYLSSSTIYIGIQGDKITLNGQADGPVVDGFSGYSKHQTIHTSFTLHPNQAKGGTLGGMDYAIENIDGKFYMADGCNDAMQSDIVYHLNYPNEPVS